MEDEFPMNSFHSRFLTITFFDRNDMSRDYHNFLDIEFKKFMFRLQLGDKLSAELKATKGMPKMVKFKMTSIPIEHFMLLVNISNGVIQKKKKTTKSSSFYQPEKGYLNKQYVSQDKFSVQICCVNDLFPFLGHSFFRYPVADSDHSGGGCPDRFPFSQYHAVESQIEFQYDMINQILEVKAPTKGIPRSFSANSSLPPHPSTSQDFGLLKNELEGKFFILPDDSAIGYEICLLQRDYGGYKDKKGMFSQLQYILNVLYLME